MNIITHKIAFISEEQFSLNKLKYDKRHAKSLAKVEAGYRETDKGCAGENFVLYKIGARLKTDLAAYLRVNNPSHMPTYLVAQLLAAQLKEHEKIPELDDYYVARQYLEENHHRVEGFVRAPADLTRRKHDMKARIRIEGDADSNRV